MLNDLIIGTCAYTVQYVQHRCTVNINLHSLHPCLYSWSGRIQAERSERWNQQTSPRKGSLGRPDQGSRWSRLQGINQSSTYSQMFYKETASFRHYIFMYKKNALISFTEKCISSHLTAIIPVQKKNNDCKSYSRNIKLNYVPSNPLRLYWNICILIYAYCDKLSLIDFCGS